MPTRAGLLPSVKWRFASQARGNDNYGCVCVADTAVDHDVCLTSFKPHKHCEAAVHIIPIFITATCKDSVSLKRSLAHCKISLKVVAIVHINQRHYVSSLKLPTIGVATLGKLAIMTIQVFVGMCLYMSHYPHPPFYRNNLKFGLY